MGRSYAKLKEVEAAEQDGYLERRFFEKPELCPELCYERNASWRLRTYNRPRREEEFFVVLDLPNQSGSTTSKATLSYTLILLTAVLGFGFDCENKVAPSAIELSQSADVCVS